MQYWSKRRRLNQFVRYNLYPVEVPLYEHALLTPKPEERDLIKQRIAEKGDFQKGVRVTEATPNRWGSLKISWAV
ncbi:MAG: hypothetical protein AAFQ78_00670 [Bacteroidota bacterium]